MMVIFMVIIDGFHPNKLIAKSTYFKRNEVYEAMVRLLIAKEINVC